MSSIAITPSATGAGVITLAAPITATNRTITLPDATGTLLSTATPGVPIGGPAFSAYVNTAQAFGSNTYTKIQFGVEEFDTANAFDNVTNYRFQPQVAGYYQVSLVATTSLGSTYFELDIFKNGSRFKGTQNNTFFAITVSALVYLNGSTDYLEGYLFVTGANTLSTFGPPFNYFQAFLARSAT